MQNVYTAPEQPENILDGADTSLHVARRSIRFANFFIDTILCDMIITIFHYFYLKDSVDPSQPYTPEKAFDFVWAFYGYSFLIYIVYNTLFEWLSEGKSLGKLITGTRAVEEDGARIDFKKAILRTLCRMIPFEMFSAFGSPSHPWHDALTKTLVINERRSHFPS